ncbi:MAG: hypothetical protein HZA24_00375 [Nitrospirae bacterium]|nr:hypothetical protein [Nitrospirota bacterium]
MQESAAWYAADGNLRLEQDVAYDLETDPYRAAYHAEVILKKSREGLVCAFLATLDALQVAVGDVVAVTHPGPGWTAKPFRVTHLELHPDGNVAVQLREHDPTAYDRTVPTGLPAPPDTSLPDPFTVQSPTGLVLASGASHLYVAGDGTVVSRIHAAWVPAADAYLDGYEVQVKESASGTWLPAAAPDAGDTEAYLSPVKDGTAYDVRIRAYNTLGVRSAWATVTGHTVIGKTDPPADVTGFGAFQNGDVVVFQWGQVADVDLAGYEIRYGPLGSATWADGTPLTEVTRGTQITSAAVPPGGWTFLVKARDTSGNYSTGAAAKDLTVVNALDVIFQAQQAPAWPGMKTGFLAHWTGVLVPDSTLGAAAHTNAELFETFVPYPVAQAIYEAPEMDGGFDDTVRVWGEVASALGTGVATGVADPKLEIDHRLEAGAYDGFTPWAVGQVTARFVKHRLVLDTARGRAKITGFLPTVDVRERTEKATDVAVAAGGTAITFARPFHRKPEVRVTAIGSTARIAGANNVTTTGFTAHVFDTGGADVGGTVNWSAEGG